MTDTPEKTEIKADADKRPKPEARRTWLTERPSEEFGPTGRFVDLTEAEVRAAPEGVLVRPTAEQLAQRA